MIASRQEKNYFEPVLFDRFTNGVVSPSPFTSKTISHCEERETLITLPVMSVSIHELLRANLVDLDFISLPAGR
jgi:hypothetical protein